MDGLLAPSLRLLLFAATSLLGPMSSAETGDRQPRYSNRLPMPPQPAFGANIALEDLSPQRTEPLAEIDGNPGVYGGVEWRYARRTQPKLAVY